MLLLLVLLLTLGWFFGGLDDRRDDARQEALADVRQSAHRIGEQLLDLARGDKLAEDVVRSMLARSQAKLLDFTSAANRVDVIAEVHAVETADLGSVAVARCFRFVVTGTGTDDVAQSSTMLDSCPPPTG